MTRQLFPFIHLNGHVQKKETAKKMLGLATNDVENSSKQHKQLNNYTSKVQQIKKKRKEK